MEGVGNGQREMFFSDEFFPKITGRLQVMLNCIKNKTEISDSDYEILKEIHKLWFEGKFGWSKPIIPELAKTVKDVGLFDISYNETPDNLDDARDKLIDGKDFVESVTEPKKKRKK